MTVASKILSKNCCLFCSFFSRSSFLSGSSSGFSFCCGSGCLSFLLSHSFCLCLILGYFSLETSLGIKFFLVGHRGTELVD